jgi:hypothetical protein
LCFDCNIWYEIRCDIFHLWHQVGPQNVLDFGTFGFQSFGLQMLNLCFPPGVPKTHWHPTGPQYMILLPHLPEDGDIWPVRWGFWIFCSRKLHSFKLPCSVPSIFPVPSLLAPTQHTKILPLPVQEGCLGLTLPIQEEFLSAFPIEVSFLPVISVLSIYLIFTFLLRMFSGRHFSTCQTVMVNGSLGDSHQMEGWQKILYIMLFCIFQILYNKNTEEIFFIFKKIIYPVLTIKGLRLLPGRHFGRLIMTQHRHNLHHSVLVMIQQCHINSPSKSCVKNDTSLA